MRTVFLHGEAAQYLAAKAQLVERFTTWCAEEVADAPTELIDLLLEEKFSQDGLLARWTERDLERFLLEVVPRRLALDAGWSSVPEALHLWVDFLEHAELLVHADRAASWSMRDLHAAIDAATPAYLAAMAEPGEWGAAKFWSVTMAEHGVDIEDEQAVEDFFAAVDDGEIDVEQSVLDAIEDRDLLGPATEPAFWLPPMVVPGPRTPELDAPETAVLASMNVLHEWSRQGRSLDAAGALEQSELDELAAALGDPDEPADAFATRVLVEWARAADLVRVVGERLVPTQISTGLLEQPGLLWTRLWQNFVLLDDVFEDQILGGSEEAGSGDEASDDEDLGDEDLDDEASDDEDSDDEDSGDGDSDGESGEPAELGDDAFSSVVHAALTALYAHTDAVPLEFVVDAVLESLLADAEDPADIAAARGTVRRVLVRVLDQWELMGAVGRFETTDPELVEIIDAAVPDDVEPEHVMVELSQLGVWAAHTSLTAFGFVAPTSDEMVRHGAEVLVLAITASPADVVDEILHGWVAERGAQQASEELADLVRRVDDPAVRVPAFWVLEQTGAAGVTAVLGLVDDPIAGASARVWLRESPEGIAPRPGDELAHALDGMSISAVEDPEALLDELRRRSESEQVALIEEIPASGHSHAGAVLTAIAETHPDAQVGDAARRSLARVRPESG